MIIQYDPKKVYRFAARMYSDALAYEIFSIVVAIFFLVATWYLATINSRSFFGFNLQDYLWQTWALGILIGVAILFAGHSHAESLRAQAQILMCQVEIERNTANMVHDAITERPKETQGDASTPSV